MMRERVPGSPGPGIVGARDARPPPQTHFFEALKKNKKNDPKSQMDPKVCQFGTQNGH